MAVSSSNRETRRAPHARDRGPTPERLALHEALLEALALGGLGVVLVDLLERRVVYANQAAQRLTGRSEEELLRGTSLLEPLAPEERIPMEARIQDHLDRWETSDAGEVVLLHRDGTRVPVEYQARMVQVGEAVFVVGLLRDVTGERRERAHRAAVLRDLADLEADRLREGERRELRRALAHDVGNPLTAARLALHALRRDGASLSPGARRAVDVARRSVDRVARTLALDREPGREAAAKERPAPTP